MTMQSWVIEFFVIFMGMHRLSGITRHMSHLAQDGSGDLDIGELNNVLASISGGAMSAGNDHKNYDVDQIVASTMAKTSNESKSSTH
jgi:hypothetical protein